MGAWAVPILWLRTHPLSDSVEPQVSISGVNEREWVNVCDELDKWTDEKYSEIIISLPPDSTMHSK